MQEYKPKPKQRNPNRERKRISGNKFSQAANSALCDLFLKEAKGRTAEKGREPVSKVKKLIKRTSHKRKSYNHTHMVTAN